MFDNFNVNLRKNEGFPTCIPCIPIPECSQSNAPLDQLKASGKIKTPVSQNGLGSLFVSDDVDFRVEHSFISHQVSPFSLRLHKLGLK